MAQPKDGGRYVITTSSGSLALSAQDSKITLSAFAGDATPSQTWKLSKIGEEYGQTIYNITSSTSGNALTIRYFGMLEDKLPVYLVKGGPAIAQKWYFEPAGDEGSFRIFSTLAMNLCLPEGASESTEIYTWIRDQTEKSAFRLVEV